ncbi:UNKNOWN [Stylonychia lemnae]|uniref:Uncharacterized protein n=1 Tax=Stylonychia lemnae TaxID=5949 RepID=A0A078AQX7_STYLE|nr:UNKNOWN [Stylonychia lemnae]|eukprot:CDW83652.1 UNKNOWN [Stylonychia lemnae]
MEEQFTPFTNTQFEKSDKLNQLYFATPSQSNNQLLKLSKFDSEYGSSSEVSTQKSTPTIGLSPLTRSSSEDEDKTSLFSSSDLADKQDFHYESSTMKCSRNLKFLLEAEEEMASIWQNANKKSITKPVVLIKQKNTTESNDDHSGIKRSSSQPHNLLDLVPERVSLNFERQMSEQQLIPQRPRNPMALDQDYNGNYQFIQDKQRGFSEPSQNLYNSQPYFQEQYFNNTYETQQQYYNSYHQEYSMFSYQNQMQGQYLGANDCYHYQPVSHFQYGYPLYQ